MVGVAKRLHCSVNCGECCAPIGSGSRITKTRFRKSGLVVMPHVSVRAICGGASNGDVRGRVRAGTWEVGAEGHAICLGMHNMDGGQRGSEAGQNGRCMLNSEGRAGYKGEAVSYVQAGRESMLGVWG